jgi:hypothetical protein
MSIGNIEGMRFKVGTVPTQDMYPDLRTSVTSSETVLSHIQKTDATEFAHRYNDVAVHAELEGCSPSGNTALESHINRATSASKRIEEGQAGATT